MKLKDHYDQDLNKLLPHDEWAELLQCDPEYEAWVEDFLTGQEDSAEGENDAEL